MRSGTAVPEDSPPAMPVVVWWRSRRDEGGGRCGSRAETVAGVMLAVMEFRSRVAGSVSANTPHASDAATLTLVGAPDSFSWHAVEPESAACASAVTHSRTHKSPTGTPVVMTRRTVTMARVSARVTHPV
jgi:hypothetical protein